jgi:hypothetical protein
VVATGFVSNETDVWSEIDGPWAPIEAGAACLTLAVPPRNADHDRDGGSIADLDPATRIGAEHEPDPFVSDDGAFASLEHEVETILFAERLEYSERLFERQPEHAGYHAGWRLTG